MSGTTKRLDIQFGSFACSVQGFDDPVQPVQQVLQALQNLLEETPELGDSGISFDSEAIDRLIGEVARRADLDETDIEIVPGLIIVHRHEDQVAADSDADDGVLDGAISGRVEFDATEPGEVESTTPEASGGSEDADGADPGFANLFASKDGEEIDDDTEAAPRSGLFRTVTDDPLEPAEADGAAGRQDDPFFADLATISSLKTKDSSEDIAEEDQKTDSIQDIFSDDAGGADLAEPLVLSSGAEPEDADTSIRFFSSPGGAAEPDSVAEPDEMAEADGEPGNIFTRVALEETAEVPEGLDEDSARGEALFGPTEEQPEAREVDEGYTAAGLAKTAGAESVAELMISAAAWMVLIQGQTTFTRNDVVKVFEEMPGEHAKTLEARVKGFGKAVRNGELVPIEEGVFGLSQVELERFQRLL